LPELSEIRQLQAKEVQWLPRMWSNPETIVKKAIENFDAAQTPAPFSTDPILRRTNTNAQPKLRVVKS